MKKFRIVALAMALVLMLSCFIACESKEKITVTADVKVVDGDGEVLIDTAVQIEHSEPTVLMAIVQACQDEDIIIETDGKDVTKIGGFEAVDEEDYLYFWDCTFNYKAIEGKAGDTILTADQNHVIVYKYASIKVESTDEETAE